MNRLKEKCSRVFNTIDKKSVYGASEDCDESLFDNCRLLKLSLENIMKWASDYDLAEGVNGYWSWVRVSTNFGTLVLKKCNERGTQSALNDKRLINASKALLIGLEVVHKVRSDSIAQSIKRDKSELEFLEKPLAQGVDCQLKFDTQAMSLFSFYDSCASEGLLLFNQIVEENGTGLSSFFSLWSVLLNITFKTSLSDYLCLVAFNLFDPKQALDLMFELKQLYRYSTKKLIPFGYVDDLVVEKDIIVPQSKWTINPIQGDVIIKENYGQKKFLVSVHFNQNISVERLNSIIIHCKERNSDQPNVIVSTESVPVIDLLCSPFNPFPNNLQELLDIYLWLLSNKSKKALGFSPEKIILCGKGFGGNVVLALCCLLHEMRNKKDSELHGLIPLPSAVVTVNSPFLSKILMSPSKALGCLNAFESFAGSCEKCDCYVTRDAAVVGRRPVFLFCVSSFTLKEQVKHLIKLSLSFGKYVFRRVLRTRFSSEEPSPWTGSDITLLNQKVTLINTIGSSPFVSPLLYHDVEAVAEKVPLYLITSHFDPNLDDNVSLAKAWKNNVKLDVIETKSRGYLNFVLNKEADRVFLNRIADALTVTRDMKNI